MSESSLNNEQRSRPYWLKPMPMRDGRPSAYRRLKTKLRNGQRNGLLMLGLMLLVVLLLSGCCTMQPIPPSEPPTIPTPPVSQLSPPAQTYSSSAANDIQAWQKALTNGLPKQ